MTTTSTTNRHTLKALWTFVFFEGEINPSNIKVNVGILEEFCLNVLSISGKNILLSLSLYLSSFFPR